MKGFVLTKLYTTVTRKKLKRIFQSDAHTRNEMSDIKIILLQSRLFSENNILC